MIHVLSDSEISLKQLAIIEFEHSASKQACTHPADMNINRNVKVFEEVSNSEGAQDVFTDSNACAVNSSAWPSVGLRLKICSSLFKRLSGITDFS